MGDSPRERYHSARDDLDAARGGTVTAGDHDAIIEYLDAWDPNRAVPTPEGETPHSYNTLANHAWTLKSVAERIDGEIHDTSLGVINELIERELSGAHPDVKDGGLAASSVGTKASVIRSFVSYHDMDIDPSDIFRPESEETPVDERDMFTGEEINCLREAAPNARDRALVDMLLYTGQRARAIQTLRIKDIDLENGRFYLNTDAAGLKGASGKRPLLGAVSSIRDWLSMHPAGDDPESAVFTKLSSASQGTVGEPLSRSNINARLHKIGDLAGVDKPTNAHNFRHNFVTIAKRNYDLSNSEIKHLIGHRPDSDVMETTYSHLTDEEVAENVAVKAGFEEPDDESPLSPPACTTCDEPLPENAKACPACGEVFTPDAKAAEEQIEDMLYEGRAEDDGEHAETIDELRERIRNDPEAKAAVVEELLGEDFET